jgi:hypothetical protein
VNVLLSDIGVRRESSWSVVAEEPNVLLAQWSVALDARTALQARDDGFAGEMSVRSVFAQVDRTETHMQTFMPTFSRSPSTPSPTSSIVPENSCPRVAGTVSPVE